MIITLVSVAAYILGILLWPYALQAPVKNVLESYNLMAHFPSTFRQVFEGQMIWSDMMPWYYLPKSMAITIPFVVLTGFLIFWILIKQHIKSGKVLLYGLVIFTILFPVCFVIAQQSNIYSSWRQFLFIYPAIVLIAATGFSTLYDTLNKKLLRILMVAVVILLALHPLKFMALNPRYYYLYYNQFTGGLKGAYGNYETDYYYVSQTEGAELFLEYLKENNVDSAVVMTTSPDNWHFRKNPAIKPVYVRYEERSMNEWDYAIVGSRFIQPAKLKSGMWPPKNTIHIIYAGDVPVGAVLKRTGNADYEGFNALQEGRNGEAIKFFEEALKSDAVDEMIFYNFARALYNDGQHQKADSVLKAGLELNPESELILMYLGNIASFRNDSILALEYYERVIGANRKYFQAYVESAKLLSVKDVEKARKLLRECLKMNPKFKPAITGLADTYRLTNPDIAKKYDEIAATIK